ncbi:MAG: asparaginase [Eubacteriaceae bacterium]
MEKKAKILLLLTGGTIGSSVNNGTINVDSTRGDDLLSLYKKTEKIPVEFEVFQPYNLLSENAEPKHWLEIINTLRQFDLSSYTGVMIAHGSDTLPYTGAALCFGLDTPNIPIVLVAANYALGHPKSNALENFTSAVDFIINQQLPGFYVVYKNQDNQNYVHLASRLLEADWIYDDFNSFGNLPFGTIDHRGLCCIPSKKNPTMIQLYNPEPNLVPWVDCFNNEILGLRAFPGLNYENIDLSKGNIKAVLHSLYHCGSGNVIGEHGTSLLKFIRNNPQVDHYMISYKNIHDDLYHSCHQLIKSGAIPLENISFEATITKLYFAYNQPEYAPEDYIQREFFYEFLREKPENGYVI